MITIYWKEIWENLKWGLLLLGVFGFFLAVAHGNARELYPSVVADVLFIYGAAGAGLLMGLFQIAFEAWTDKWAFLIHRPVSRTSMFLGKMLAGWTLLLLALGIPWIVSVIWSVRPGHRMSPFYWQMLLPPIADILSSFVYWFAGMLIGLRTARWYGSRIFPIAFPLLCSLFIWVVPEFWQALLVILIGGIVMYLAAWGAFQSGGAYTSQPKLAKPLLATVLFPAVAALVFFATAMGVSLLQMGPRSFDYSYYDFDAAGTPFLFRYRYDGGRFTSTTVTDLEGNPVERYSGLMPGAAETRGMFLGFCGIRLDGDRRSWPGPMLGYRSANRFYADLYPHMRPRPGDTGRTERSLLPDNEKWLYCFPERLMRGYNWSDWRFIGFITPSGFSPASEPPAERFADGGPDIAGLAYYGYGATGRFMTFSTAIYELQLQEHRVNRIFTTSSDDPIVSMAESPENSEREFLLVATKRRILMLDGQHRQMFATAMPADAARYGVAQLAPLPQGGHYLMRLSNLNDQNPWGKRGEERVLELAADGSLVRQFDLPPLPLPVLHSWRATVEPAIVGVIMPAGAVAFLKAAAVASPNEILREFFGGFVRELTESGGATFMISLALTAVLAGAVAVNVSRRYAFSVGRTVGWAVAGLLLGPIGLLLMWCLLDWPAREACPACSKKRVVTRELCEHCATTFPPSAREAADIFA